MRLENYLIDVVKIKEPNLDKHKIKYGRAQVGVISTTLKKNFDIQKTIKDFREKERQQTIGNFLETLNLPEQFNYMWINSITIIPKMKGKGFGTFAIEETIKQTPKPVLVGLVITDITNKHPEEKLKLFYKKNNFKFVEYGSSTFGWKFVT